MNTLEKTTKEIVKRANRLMHREGTDFIGRMEEALTRADGLCTPALYCHKGMKPKRVAKYREQMLELAALALAQAAMSDTSES